MAHARATLPSLTVPACCQALLALIELPEDTEAAAADEDTDAGFAVEESAGYSRPGHSTGRLAVRWAHAESRCS